MRPECLSVEWGWHCVQITGPKSELDSLKEELADLKPTYFEEV